MGGADTFKELVDELPDLVCRYRPDGTLLYVNPAYASYHLKTVDELIGTNLLDLIPPEVRAVVAAELADMRGMTPDRAVQTQEHWSGDGFGRIRWHEWLDKAIFDAEGRLVEFISSGRDVSERREAQDRIALTARFDDLTGVLNRRALLDELDIVIARAHGNRRTLGVLFVDLDGFKHVNDEFGHAAGDRLLAAAGDALAGSVRAGDLVGRVGGDEFVVVCTGVATLAHLGVAAERVRARLADLDRPCHASIGTALLRRTDDAALLLRRADLAMYADKTRRHVAAAHRA